MLTKITFQLPDENLTSIDRALEWVLTDPSKRMYKFILDYVRFNNLAGSGVLRLVSNVIPFAVKNFYRDDKDHNYITATLIAQHIFEAGIDEFKYNHCKMAYDLKLGTEDFYTIDPVSSINEVPLGEFIFNRYNDPDLFIALGFHLGSEFCADIEFRMILESLSSSAPDFIKFLKSKYPLGYKWIEIHASIEEEHFNHAIRATNLALSVFNFNNKAEQSIQVGYHSFCKIQKGFFDRFV